MNNVHNVLVNDAPESMKTNKPGKPGLAIERYQFTFIIGKN